MSPTTIIIAVLALAIASEASAQSRAFYDSSGKRIGSATADSQRHGDELRCARPGH
jgi:hypothetical protein